MKTGKYRTRRGFLLAAVGSGAISSSFAQIRRPFEGTVAGEERELHGIKLRWCPAGRFVMGSPRQEPERRPEENQVEVRLSKGFWTAKYEATQGQWRSLSGDLPGPLTAQLPEGNRFPVGNVNFAEAEGSVGFSVSTLMNPVNFPGIGSSACRPKRSGNMRAAQEQRLRLLSATASAANRQILQEHPTTEVTEDHH